ncbi:MAG: VIT domain-containing protein [Pseudomonadota bacterium]
MQRGFAVSAALTLFLGLVFGQAAAQRAPNRHGPPPRPEPALIAPPLIAAPEAERPVVLRDAALRIETDGSLARTTLDLVVHNPNDRALEGTLEFPLQPGQQVAGFALDVGGEMRDAVPVPKQKAQQVFESIERRNVDPGLLEQTAGNHFRLRIYPIPARGTRHARLVIDEAMRNDRGAARLEVPVHLFAGAESFRLALRAQGLRRAPEVVGAFDGLKFQRTGGGFVANVERSAFRPETGLGLRFPVGSEPQGYVQIVGDERYALVELALPAPIPGAVPPRRMPKSIGLLWDASASARHRDRQSELSVLDRYFQAVRNATVSLRVLRDVGEDLGRFEIRDGEWGALRRALESQIDDGASDLADWTPQPDIEQYLLVSDGLQTYGARAFPRLGNGQTLTAISSAGARTDAARLTALSEARGGRLVMWQGRDGIDAAAAALIHPPTRILSLEGEGIEALQPQHWHIDAGPIRVAGRLTEPTATIRIVLEEAGRRRTLEARVAADAPVSSQVGALWAGWRATGLAGEPERHRGEIARLGQRFGIVTPGTSLLVLEAAADYVRYDIPAPAALRAEVDALRRTQVAEKAQSRSRRLDDVAARFADRIEWWKKSYPKGAPPKPEAPKVAAAADRAAPVGMAAPPPPPAPSPSRREDASDNEELDAVAVTGQRIRRSEAQSASPATTMAREEVARQGLESAANAPGEASTAGQGVSIQLQAWAPDSPYARRLRDAKAEDLYTAYLDERDSHADSTAFYLDVADLLLKKDRRAEALRVLSNLAELDLENRHVLRVLGYRLMQAKDYARAVEVFREVLRLAEEEPQSHRDLGLALAGAGERQEAIERLYEVAARPWDARFSEVELVALNEMNAIIATSPTRLDTAFVDRRLLQNMPLDLRVVLAWDSDNSDMDLWVTDPNGERCYYGNRNTYQGGLLSDDFTGGYGPEEFVLKDAKPGKYKVEANFFGDRQQIVTGATTLNLVFSTGWGTPRRKDESVTLRLSGKSETVFVGEFEVK